MGEAADRELLEVADSFRARARRIMLAVVINFTLAALCLGVPYVRGRMRAKESQQRFGSFAACLLDGKSAPRPGLSMPPGTANRFAAQYLEDDPKWPGGCLAALDAVAPPEAIFLWPAIKQSDADVRATVDLLRRELTTMADERGDSGDVPVRPLLALQKVRAALTLQARAAGNDHELDGNAVTLPRDGGPPIPATLPLGTPDDASLELWTAGGGLEAFSLDRAGITWMRVAQGEVDRTRMRRTSLVRGGLLQSRVPYILWATPEERCAARDDHCLQRATGVARYELGSTELPKPTWVAGHPAGSLAHSVRIEGSTLWLLARASVDGAIEVREFTLPDEVEEDAKPVAPTRRYGPEGSVAAGARLLPGEPPSIYVPERHGDGVRPRVVHADGTSHVLSASGPDRPWAVGCDGGAHTWLAHGDAYGLRISRLAAGGESTELVSLAAKLRKAPAGRRSAVRLHCADGAADVFFLTHDLKLRHAHCDEAGCQKETDLAHSVVNFTSALTADGKLVVATSGGRNFKRIQTITRSNNGKWSEPATATACWHDGDGLCGTPHLVADGERLLLASRGSGDLRVLESRDGGREWETMSGLKVGQAMTEGAHPLEQHRVRKGIH